MNQEMEKKVGAVLVVGGGIGGIQASLDLADSGYKVYLVPSLIRPSPPTTAPCVSSPPSWWNVADTPI